MAKRGQKNWKRGNNLGPDSPDSFSSQTPCSKVQTTNAESLALASAPKV